ncbi:hypothetical protein BS78_05G085900 [Paspalum vaginatum]|nr:hypothetical protein BS78_05G085900 [Paspalum vaginatum]
MGEAGAPVPAWRSACLALCLLPVALPLLLLCLPLLCVAVAVARFRRRRRRLLRLKTTTKRRSCCCPGERPSPGEEQAGGDAHRAALLHKYLEDQMELVGAAEAADAGAVGSLRSGGGSGAGEKP